MKSKILLAGIAFCLLIFTNCKEKPGEGSATEGQTTATPIAPANLVGYWVNEDWWKELQATKSPKQAAANLKGIAGGIFLPNGEQTIANLSFGWHEGMQYTVRTRAGKQELYDPANAAVPTIQLTPLAGGTIQLDSSALVRLAPGIEGAKVVGHVVLGGQWDMKGKAVVFNPNGTVAGLDNYRYYELLLDYVTDEVGADQLTLSENGGQPKFFAFKIEGEKLVISDISEAGGAYKVGKVRYQLAKQ